MYDLFNILVFISQSLFQLPSIEVVIKTPPAGRDQTRPPILVLVICPTRELASQAASEAKTLLKYHPSIGVQVVIGGTRLAVEQKRMQANPCQVRYMNLASSWLCLRHHVVYVGTFYYFLFIICSLEHKVYLALLSDSRSYTWAIKGPS